METILTERDQFEVTIRCKHCESTDTSYQIYCYYPEHLSRLEFACLNCGAETEYYDA